MLLLSRFGAEEKEYLEHLLLQSEYLATLSRCYIANSNSGNDNNIYAIMNFMQSLPGIYEVVFADVCEA